MAFPDHPLFHRTLRFTHRVNSRGALDDFLDSEHEVAETDIMIGAHLRWPIPRLGRLISAHPPRFWSTLSLDHLIGRLADHDRAIKADFKEREPLEAGLRSITSRLPASDTIINIDCAPGPGAKSPPFSLEDARRIAGDAPGAVVSIGMRTRFFGGPYRAVHTDRALDIADALDAPVTICARVQQALAEPRALDPIVDAGVRLTLWNSGVRNPASKAMVARLRAEWPDAWLDLS